ncbi:hypothetical protein [Sanguibacter suaedae]|uniref:Methionine synthase n=1 Tax=Sanguibacter suaedae TaxID=2795737 RepID=A0A934MC64_9MICO|nr:hypothetical protein [Sanguibacter suaedae]MBI9116066.1 hypothetical protein [Sanguibacter suaedae]
MTGVTGPGPWPGPDVLDAQSAVLGDLVDVPEGVDGLPFTVQLASRGPGAEPLGRTAALLVDMPSELGPHGWRLSDRPGLDLERSRAYLREDLDALAVAGYGYAGPLTVQVLGPWTLAASLYLARGDRVLSDAGAVRSLVESLTAGVSDHVAAVRAQVPGAEVVVQVHEPLVAQVAAGVLPTFSGYSRLRAVEGPALVDGLRPLLDGVRALGARNVVHVGRSWVGVAPAVHAGAEDLGLDLAPVATWDERVWELVARATERGMRLWAGLPPAHISQCAGADVRGLADVVAVPWRRLGLPLEGLSDVVLTSPLGPLTGPAPGSSEEARGALGTTVRAAGALADLAHG